MTDALDAILTAGDLVAVLGREVPVRLVDISNAGCRLESRGRLDKGATGLLRVKFQDVEYMDDIRVMRCHEPEGSSGMYLLGAEFLWTTSPHNRSLRRVLAQVQGNVMRNAGFDRRM